MRPCGAALAAVLAAGIPELAIADLYDVTTQDGTEFHWTNFDYAIPYGGNTYTNLGPYLTRKKLSTVNTMAVPTLELELLCAPQAFNGGADMMSQMHNGYFDGSTVVLNRFFTPLPILNPNEIDNTLGAILYFGGVTSTLEIEGIKTTFKVKGANNRLDQYAPRNIFQLGCLHNFCDSGCTLSAPTYTFNFTVNTTPTPTTYFVPWTVPPADPTLFQLGTITMTGGAASGQARDIAYADSTGVYLIYPLYATPVPGDTFTAFEGCDKTQTTCNLPSRNNLQNWRGFPFIPPAFQNF